MGEERRGEEEGGGGGGGAMSSPISTLVFFFFFCCPFLCSVAEYINQQLQNSNLHIKHYHGFIVFCYKISLFMKYAIGLYIVILLTNIKKKIWSMNIFLYA